MMTFEFSAEMTMPALARLRMQERLARATPADTTRGLFFNSVLQQVRAEADDEAARRCRLMLGQSRFFDFFQYGVFDLLRLSFNAAQYLSTSPGGFEAALRRLGQRGMSDFLSSLAGRTFLNFCGEDARRTLSSLPMLFRTVASYGERTVEWLGPRSCHVVMKRDFMPPLYQEGALLSVMEQLHLKGGRVQGHPTGALESEYSLSWE